MAGRKKKNDTGMVMQALVMVFQFGINMLVPILMCTFLGIWIGNRWDCLWITVPLFFAGAIAGGQNIYRMSKKLIGQDRHTPEKKS